MANSKLIINYLPQTLTDKELHSLFDSIGQIENCQIMRNYKTGYSFGYGFVQYANFEDAEKAIQQLNGLRVLNKRIKVSYARPSGESIKDTNLYITNVPRHYSEDDLEDIFRPFGTIVQKHILCDKFTGQSRGVAFVRFDRREEAQNAIQHLDNQMLEDSTERLGVRLAEEHGKKRAALYMNQGIGQDQADFLHLNEVEKLWTQARKGVFDSSYKAFKPSQGFPGDPRINNQSGFGNSNILKSFQGVSGVNINHRINNRGGFGNSYNNDFKPLQGFPGDPRINNQSGVGNSNILNSFQGVPGVKINHRINNRGGFGSSYNDFKPLQEFPGSDPKINNQCGFGNSNIFKPLQGVSGVNMNHRTNNRSDFGSRYRPSTYKPFRGVSGISNESNIGAQSGPMRLEKKQNRFNPLASMTSYSGSF